MCIQNAQRFVISDEEYETFCDRHQHQKSFVPESNAVMKSSYVRSPCPITHAFEGDLLTDLPFTAHLG